MNSKITNSSYASTSTSPSHRGEDLAHLFPGVGMVMVKNCVIDHKGRRHNSPSEGLIFLMREQGDLSIDPVTSPQNAPALPETSGQRFILRAARQGALIPRCGVGGSRLNRVRNLPR